MAECNVKLIIKTEKKEKKAKQTYEEYKQKRAEAIEIFRDFLRNCSKKEITIQQLSIIGLCAQEEVNKFIHEIHAQTKINEDLNDLLPDTYG